MDQHDLFVDLEGMRRSLAKLLPQLPPHAEDWRPRENMRTVWELANHLAQIPAVDTLISAEAAQAAVQAREKKLWASTPEGLLTDFDRGIREAGERFGAMASEAFESAVTKAFYGHAMPAKAWLLEIATHCHHHRAMLYTYLKLLGRPLDMSYLYA